MSVKKVKKPKPKTEKPKPKLSQEQLEQQVLAWYNSLTAGERYTVAQVANLFGVTEQTMLDVLAKLRGNGICPQMNHILYRKK